jgi:hypothetical protein
LVPTNTAGIILGEIVPPLQRVFSSIPSNHGQTKKIIGLKAPRHGLNGTILKMEHQ